MTSTGFFLFGMKKAEINLINGDGFQNIMPKMKLYGETVGEYIGSVLLFFNDLDFSYATSHVKVLAPNICLTHNDFYSNVLYRQIIKRAKLCEKHMAPAVFFLLNQINIAYSLLPKVLSSKSNLLLRMQFLTAYHATNSLKMVNGFDSEMKQLLIKENVLTTIPEVSKIRNLLAHYGFGESKKFVKGNSDPMNELITGLSGLSKRELTTGVDAYLGELSKWTQSKFSKSQLQKYNAILGDNT